MESITEQIIEEFLQVRDTGEVSMLNRQGVQIVAFGEGMYHLTMWIENNKRDYPVLLQTVSQHLMDEKETNE